MLNFAAEVLSEADRPVVVVCGRGDAAALRRLRRLKDLTLHRTLPYGRLIELLERSRALLTDTSLAALEGPAAGVPVIGVSGRRGPEDARAALAAALRRPTGTRHGVAVEWDAAAACRAIRAPVRRAVTFL